MIKDGNGSDVQWRAVGGVAILFFFTSSQGAAFLRSKIGRCK